MVNCNLSECIESKSQLTISFDGGNDIDAALLIQSLTSCASILQDTTMFSCPEAYLKLKISPFKPGSFRVTFEALLTGIAPLAIVAPQAIDLAKNVCDTFILYFKLKEVLKGKKPKREIPNGELVTVIGENNNGNNQITLNQNTYNFYQRPQINEAVAGLFDLLAKDGTRTGMTIQSNEEHMTIPHALFSELATPENFDKPNTVISETISTTELYVKKPDLMGRSKWGFYDGRIFDATIEDEEFLKRVKMGKYSFGCGVKISAKLKTVYNLDEYGFPIMGTEKFFILEVLDVIEKVHNEEIRQISF